MTTIHNSIIENFNNSNALDTSEQVITTELQRHARIQAWERLIKKIPSKNHNLDFDTLGKLVPIVEGLMENKKTLFHYQRDNGSYSPRKFIYDKKKQSLLIISKRHGVQRADRYRKVSDAIEIRFQGSTPVSAKHVFWVVNQRNKESFTKRDALLEKQFGDLHDAISFQRKDGKQAVGLVITPYDVTLDEVLPTLNGRQRVEIVSHLIEHLRQIHAQKFIYANIKLENVQITQNHDGSYRVRFGNFSNSYKVGSKKNFPKKGFLKFHYGNATLTAPEHVLEPVKTLKDKGKQAIAEEKFALGCLIYEIYQKRRIFEKESEAWNEERFKSLPELARLSRNPFDKGLLQAVQKLYNFTPHKRCEIDELTRDFERLKLEKNQEVCETSSPSESTESYSDNSTASYSDSFYHSSVSE